MYEVDTQNEKGISISPWQVTRKFVQELPSTPTTFRGFTVLHVLLQVNMKGRLLQPAGCCADFVQLSDIRWKIRPIQQDSHVT